MATTTRKAAQALALLGLSAIACAPPSRARAGSTDCMLRPEARIGQGPDSTFLTAVRDIVADSSGRIFVLQPQERSIKAFGPRGNLLRVYGRDGHGPGEFAGVHAAGLLGDTLWVADMQLDRLTFFQAANGALLSTLYLVPRLGADGGYLATVPDGLLNDGSTIVRARRIANPPPGSSAATVPVLRIDRAGTVVDTFAWHAAGRSSFVMSRGGVARLTRQPFGDDPLWDVASSGGAVVFVERVSARDSDSSHFVVTRLTPSGDTVFSRRIPYWPLPIPAVVTDSAIAAVVAVAVRLFPNRGEAEAVVKEALYIPRYWPPATKVIAGADGFTLVRREGLDGSPAFWVVLDTAGVEIASCPVGPRTNLHEMRFPHVWGVEADSLGVESVVRYRIDRVGPP